MVSICGLLWSSESILAQNPEGFDKMADRMESKNVPTLTKEKLLESLSKNTYLVLDSREQVEYKVSHIPGAQQVGYDQLNLEVLKKTPKDRPIVIYCSVGYRSGKVAEKIIEMGFTNVYNLHGGIFEWANFGFPLVMEGNQSTKKVHGYNEKWSKYLNAETTVPVLK